MKNFILVGIGSFLGGGLRYLVSQAMANAFPSAFPWGTMTVNVGGCLLIGFLAALPWGGGEMSSSAKMLLTTGLCGGFTTFSTFMNESNSLMKDGQYGTLCLYVAGSVALGMVAVALGHHLAGVAISLVKQE
mgnify:CR=1 FL=1